MTTTQKKPAGKPAAKGSEPKAAPKGARQGRVEADSRDKSRTVVFEDTAKHPKYGKYIRTRTHVQVHDEGNESRTGDTVEVAQCRPMSKTKNWRLVRVVQKAARD
jgi:small subunit ribosomal protein S17